ncbi:MAG: hypothetical protein NUV75_12965 [Gallionella sp.]|nr:hypothetical protein [Gallionella sp.]
MSKKDAEIYRKAAKYIESYPYSCGYLCGCCYAIDLYDKKRIEGYKSRIQNNFAGAFKPRNGGAYWWKDESDWTNPRILALCFSAAMAESGDL